MKSVTFKRPRENDENVSLNATISKASNSLTHEIQKLSERESSLSNSMRTLKHNITDMKKKEKTLSEYASDLATRAKELEVARKLHEAGQQAADEHVRDEKQMLKAELNEAERNVLLLAKKQESVANLSSRMQKKLQELAVFEEECDRDEDELASFLDMNEHSTMDCSFLEEQIKQVKKAIVDVEKQIENSELALASAKLDLVEKKSDIAKIQQQEIRTRQELLTYENKNFSFRKAIDSKAAVMKKIEIKYKERRASLKHGKNRSGTVTSKLQSRLDATVSDLRGVRADVIDMKKVLDEQAFKVKDMTEETCKIRACLEMCKRRHARSEVRWRLDLDELREKRRNVDTKREMYEAKIRELKKIENERMRKIEKYNVKLTKAAKCTSKITEFAVDLVAKEDLMKVEDEREAKKYQAQMNILRDIQERIVAAERVANDLTIYSVAPRPGTPPFGVPVPKSKLEKQLNSERKQAKMIKQQIREEKQLIANMRREQVELQSDIDNAEGVLRYLNIKKDLRKDQLELEQMHNMHRCKRDIRYMDCRIHELNALVSSRKQLIGDKQSVLNRVVTQKRFRIREEDICPLARALQMILVERSLWSTHAPVPVGHMLDSWLGRLRNQ